MNTIGISYGYHDSSASLFSSGKLLACYSEERFTRIKHDKNFPSEAIENILEDFNLKFEDIDQVILAEDPQLKFARILSSSLAAFPFTLKEFRISMSQWLGKKIWKLSDVAQHFKIPLSKVSYAEHHLCHAAYSFVASGFSESAILIVDSVGDWNSVTSYSAHKQGSEIKFVKNFEYPFPHSVALFYSTVTQYLGFKPNNDECTTMALAAFGEPKYRTEMSKILDINEDHFSLNHKFLNMLKFTKPGFSKKFELLFGKRREKNSKWSFNLLDNYTINPKDKLFADIASTSQKLFEEAVQMLARQSLQEAGSKNLCLGGGAFLNSVSNSAVASMDVVEKIYIPPDPGDGGNSIGANILLNLDLKINHLEISKALSNPLMGQQAPSLHVAGLIEQLNTESIHKYIERFNLEKFSLRIKSIESTATPEAIAKHISEGKIVAWCHGRAEIGPRALGNRSILFQPSRTDLAKIVSERVKKRFGFRPYALSLTQEEANRIFITANYKKFSSANMQFSEQIKPEFYDQVRAGMHVNGSTRPQIVNQILNPPFFELLKELKDKTGLAAVINTSFNESNEPLVNTALDALITFLRTDIKILCLDNIIIEKITKFNDK